MVLTQFVSPSPGVSGWIQNRLANARSFKRLRRSAMAYLPFLTLESDVTDIIYANWIVPVTAVDHLIPPGVKVAERNGTTILTILTYAHHHFGPSSAGALRRLFPSPLQSNWRLYVQALGDRTPKSNTVLFLANVFDSALYAVGTRLFSDVMLAHHAECFEHRRFDTCWVSRTSGEGSAPTWEIRARQTADPFLPPAFDAFFASYSEALGSLCLQEAAVAPIDGTNMLAHSEIDLPIRIETVTPLAVDEYRGGSLLKSLGAIDAPFCFLVPSVRFRALSERVIDLNKVGSR